MIGAGPAVNIVLGFAILFVVALTSASVPTQTVREVVPKTPAAGVLKPGDTILAVDGHRYPGLDSEARIERFRDEIGTHRCAGEQKDGCIAATPVTLTIKRDGKVENVSVDPEYSAAAKQTLVGFSFDSRPATIGVGTAIEPGRQLRLARRQGNHQTLRQDLRPRRTQGNLRDRRRQRRRPSDG